MTTRTTQASPSTHTMSKREKLTLAFDMSGLLNPADSESVADVVCTLTNGMTREVVPLTDPPVFAGPSISQTIDGPSELVAGDTFNLSILFNAAPSTNRWLVELSIVVIP